MLVYNPQIDRCFQPIIEEFFIRLVDQYNLNSDELDEKLNKFNRLVIKFDDSIDDLTGNFKSYLKFYRDTNTYLLNHSEIKLNKGFINYIISENREKIEQFINIAFHEQGHAVQSLLEESTWNDGLCQNKYTFNDKNEGKLLTQGKIINEFAEVINSYKLQFGNLDKEEYLGYIYIQDLCRAIISSLGISEEVLAELQMKGKGRTDYENYVRYNVGKDYKMPLIQLENALDDIYSFMIEDDKDSENGTKIKEKIALVFETIKYLTGEMLKSRFNNLKNKSDMKELALIYIDKVNRDESLLKTFNKFVTKFPKEFRIDLQQNLFEQLFDNNSIDMNKLEYEVDHIIQNETSKKVIKKQYNNNILIDKIIESIKKYDIEKNRNLKTTLNKENDDNVR